jgi:hypothetical protein
MADLTITFAGLCLLVPDHENDMLHVLMPPATGHVDHFPHIVFADENGAIQKKPIEGMHLELPPVEGSNGFDPGVGAEVFDFHSSLGRKVDKAHLGIGAISPLSKSVLARMRLTTGRYHRPRRAGGFWRHGGSAPRRIPTAVDWVIRGVDLSKLTIKNKLGAGTFEAFPSVDNKIHILIVNVMQGELDAIKELDIPPHSKCPKDMERADHLDIYRKLLTRSDLFPSLPEFDKKRTTDEGIPCPQALDSQSGSHAQHTTSASEASPWDNGTHDAYSSEPHTRSTESHTRHLRIAAGSELTCMVATGPIG